MKGSLLFAMLLSSSVRAWIISTPSSSRLLRGCRRMQMNGGLISRRSAIERGLGSAMIPFVAAYATTAATPRRASAISATSELPDEAYTTIGGDLKSCRILNGMWQTSGGHGYRPKTEIAVEAMKSYADAGFSTFDLADHYGLNTFDLADIYGPAEDLVGSYTKQYGKTGNLFYTKWVPRPEKISRTMVKQAIGRSLERMDTTSLDLLQFHWWEYDMMPYCNDALMYLQELQEDGAIKHLALTNFDTKHMSQIYDQGVKIVSNQVQYSILDQRPATRMAAAADERGISLLAYGTLLGGFLSEKWIGQPDPKGFDTVSQQKHHQVIRAWYHQMIRAWGGWPLFQELLSTLDTIAKKHKVTIPNVGVRWVIDQPAVGGAIVGVRFGYKGKEHVDDTKAVFSFKLDEEDRAMLASVTKKSNDLEEIIGDPGDEYRR